MNPVDLLKLQAEMAYTQLQDALKGVTQSEAYARLESADDDYLHSDGSIYGQALHIASGAMMYGSCAFRNQEITYRDVAAKLDEFEPDWEATLKFLGEAHRYFMASWADLRPEDLEKEFGTIWGKQWPAWKIIETVNQHNAYHAGQIAAIRYATIGSDAIPESYAEDIRKYCPELPSW